MADRRRPARPFPVAVVLTAGAVLAVVAAPLTAPSAAVEPVAPAATGGVRIAPAPTRPVAPAGTPAVIPAPYRGQSMTWQPCTSPDDYPGLPDVFYRLQCSTFRVPADWADPAAGPALTIAVSRLPARSRPAAGVTFTNPGGPGAPGLDLPLVFDLAGRTALTRTQDVYGIDVRGTGGSSNTTCGGPGLAPLLDPRDRTPRNLELLLDTAELTARFCNHAGGAVGRRITTADTVQDLELLRQLVGAGRINWLGYSAGSWLGAHYATAFPGNVARVVLDSSPDFTGSWQQAFALQPAGFERRFRDDFAPWAARQHAVLGLGRTPAEVIEAYGRIRAGLTPDTPLDSPVLLDRITAGAMYSAAEFPAAATILADLQGYLAARGSGDVAVLAAARARLARLAPRADRAARRQVARQPMASDSADAAFLSVTCNDTPWAGSRETLLQESATAASQYPLTGGGTILEPCLFWDRTAAAALPEPTGAGLPPVLMVQARRDPATPLEGAQRAAARFAGARLLLVDEGDHALYAGGNACVDATVEQFLVRGVLPAAGTTCPGKRLPRLSAAGAAATRAPVPDTGIRPDGSADLRALATASAAGRVNPLLALDAVRTTLRP